MCRCLVVMQLLNDHILITQFFIFLFYVFIWKESPSSLSFGNQRNGLRLFEGKKACAAVASSLKTQAYIILASIDSRCYENIRFLASTLANNQFHYAIAAYGWWRKLCIRFE